MKRIEPRLQAWGDVGMCAHDVLGLMRIGGEVEELFVRRIGFERAVFHITVHLASEFKRRRAAEIVIAYLVAFKAAAAARGDIKPIALP